MICTLYGGLKNRICQLKFILRKSSDYCLVMSDESRKASVRVIFHFLISFSQPPPTPLRASNKCALQESCLKRRPQFWRPEKVWQDHSIARLLSYLWVASFCPYRISCTHQWPLWNLITSQKTCSLNPSTCCVMGARASACKPGDAAQPRTLSSIVMFSCQMSHYFTSIASISPDPMFILTLGIQ